MTDESKAVFPTEERVEGPTPNGGDYAIAFYRDATGNPCPKDRATRVEIVEYIGENPIWFTIGTL